MHLNSENFGQYFNERSGQLLFVMFANNSAHFIQVESHHESEVFAKKEYLEIINNEWPELLSPFELRGVIDLAYHPTNEEIKLLRKNNINISFKISDKVYAQPGGGYSGSGIGTLPVIKALRWKKYVSQLEKNYNQAKTQVLEGIYRHSGRRQANLNLDFGYLEDRLVLIDTISGFPLELVILRGLPRGHLVSCLHGK